MRLSGEAAWCQYTGAMIAIPCAATQNGYIPCHPVDGLA
jgi:hypothetical protein